MSETRNQTEESSKEIAEDEERHYVYIGRIGKPPFVLNLKRIPLTECTKLWIKTCQVDKELYYDGLRGRGVNKSQANATITLNEEKSRESEEDDIEFVGQMIQSQDNPRQHPRQEGARPANTTPQPGVARRKRSLPRPPPKPEIEFIQELKKSDRPRGPTVDLTRERDSDEEDHYPPRPKRSRKREPYVATAKSTSSSRHHRNARASREEVCE